MITALLGLAVVLLAIEGTRRLRHSAHLGKPPLPPGPTPLPFLGNILGVNKEKPYLTHTEWSKTYGDIVYTRMLGLEIILLNTERVAVALLEKRSAIYSDRPEIGAADLFDQEWSTPVARYGSRFRLHRRLLNSAFHAKASLGYRGKQLKRTYELMTNLLDDPTHYANHFTTLSASLTMEITYGYDMKGGETFVTSMQRAGDIFLTAFTPEVSAVCTAFPFVKAFPSWFPGMGWKSEAAECRRLIPDGLNTPYLWVKRQLEQGNAAPSIVGDAITRYRVHDDAVNPELAQAIKESAGSLYSASVETTYAILLTFVYLMMNHPEVQVRARAEIDRVVGRERLPNFADRESLPYVGAVMRETMRRHPVVPLGVPRATMEEDVYEGYYIPQGVTIMYNVWAMAHDAERYPDPEVFMPERFLKQDGTLNDDNVQYIFGFGRRICPGRHVADASLWSAMACMLALFRIEKTEGSENVEWSTGLTVHPLPFPCRLVPRDDEMNSARLESLIDVTPLGL